MVVPLLIRLGMMEVGMRLLHVSDGRARVVMITLMDMDMKLDTYLSIESWM